MSNGISRPTAYKWIRRYNKVRPEGLLDLSRRPHSCSHATSEELVNEVLALRKRFPSWGARKLKVLGTHESESRVACSEHNWRVPSSLRVDESGAQEKENHAVFTTVL